MSFEFFLPLDNIQWSIYPYQPNNPSGFYDVYTKTYPLPSTSSTALDAEYPSGSSYTSRSYSYITYTISDIQPPASENPDITLATTLNIACTINSNSFTFTFNMVLYPFLNGSNVTINGGAITNLTSYDGVTGENAGVTITFLGAQYSTTGSYNLAFLYKTPSTETYSAFNQ